MMSYMLLFLILAVIPLYNVYRTRAIKRENTDMAKEQGYIQIYIIYWLLLIIAVISAPLDGLLTPPSQNLGVPLTLAAWAIGLYLAFSQFLPLALLRLPSFRAKVREHYDDKLYPVTPKQQMMFIFVAITVGICEEVLYRGFLSFFITDYLHAAPLWSCAAAAAVFGLSHFMQGLRGVWQSCLFGLLTGLLFIGSGSLLLPILIHILYDMKPVLIAKALSK